MAGYDRRDGNLRALAGVVVALGLSACSGGGGLTTAALSLPPLSLGPSQRPVLGTASDLYTRLARGVLTCWFGPRGPLRGAYVFDAEAEPPARGGRSEIVIHVKDTGSTNVRGVRAFRIAITPEGENASLTVENLKVPEPLATSLKADVERWAAGGIGCGDDATATAWSPQVPADQSENTAETRPKARSGKR